MRGNSDKKWLAGLSVFLILLTSVPYLAGYLAENPEWKFTGFLFGVEDGNSYIAKMLNGTAGEWLFRSPYTAREQNGMVAFLPYILLGKLASAPGAHDQLVALFHIFRWLGIFMVVFASYDFASLFLRDSWQRRAAVAVVTAGGGLGWLYFTGFGSLWQGGMPLEFYSPESFGFLELFGLPHLAAARSLLFWGLCRLLRNPAVPWTVREFISAGAVWFALGFFQPMHIAVGWALAAVYLAWRYIELRTGKNIHPAENRVRLKEQLRRTFLLATSSCFWIIYNAIVFKIDPYGAIWMRQNVLLSPGFVSYLMAYGWLIPPAATGVYFILRDRERETHFLIIWVLLIPVLAYAPVNIQRRLVEGAWAALVILALGGIGRLLPSNKRAQALYLAPAFLTSTLFMAGMAQAAFTHGLPAFIPRQDVACYKLLEGRIQPDQVVLAGPQVSNSLPAWVNARTVIGHGPESAELSTLNPAVERFFRGQMTPEETRQLVQANGIDYVFLGVQERQPGADFLHQLSEVITPFDGEGCRIYQIKP